LKGHGFSRAFAGRKFAALAAEGHEDRTIETFPFGAKAPSRLHHNGTAKAVPLQKMA
jgi:hypothetical protein